MQLFTFPINGYFRSLESYFFDEIKNFNPAKFLMLTRELLTRFLLILKSIKLSYNSGKFDYCRI